MFEAAVKYPYDDGDGVRALIIGSLLTLLGFLIVPTIIVTGYALSVIRSVRAGNSHPPAFGDWGELLVDGLKGTLVVIVYFLIPSVLFTGSVGATLIPVAGGLGEGTAAFGLLGLVVVLLSVPLFLVAAYLLPAALVGVALTGRIGAAFSVGRIWSLVTTSDYALAWVLALVVSLVASFLTALLTGLTLIGGLLGSLLGFYSLVVAAYLYGASVGDQFDGVGTADRRAGTASEGTGGT